MTTIDGAVVRGPGEGEALLRQRWWLPLGPDDTPGGLAMMEAVLAPGTRATRPHRHHTTDEIWYILEGTLTFRLESRQLEAAAGSCVIVPRGVIHGLHNASDDPVRYLVLLTPGRMAGYFRELGALIEATPAGPPDPAQWATIAAKYDTEFLDPPPVAD